MASVKTQRFEYRCDCVGKREKISGVCVAINPCSSDTAFPQPCGSGTICTFDKNLPGERTCECQEGHTRVDATSCKPIDMCVDFPGICGQGADCRYTQPGAYECLCRDGYDQPTEFGCSMIDPCERAPLRCGVGASCLFEGPGVHNCACHGGYDTPTKTGCTPINLCQKTPGLCGANTECSFDGPGEHSCTCSEGHEGLTRAGCLVIDPCEKDAQRCGPGTRCSFAGPGKHSCACDTGYKDLTVAGCSPINVCEETPGVCGGNTTCHYEGPGLHRCECADGYNNLKATGCDPVDACKETPGICGANTLCHPTGPGVHRCECVEGHDGLGVAGCQVINPCERTPDICGDGAECTFTNPGEHACSCSKGYRNLTASGCAAIDNCLDRPGICGASTVCRSTGPGKHRCSCVVGHDSRTKLGCVAIDHCARTPDICGEGAECTYGGPGLYSCACASLYYNVNASGVTCELKNPCDTPQYCEQFGSGLECVHSGVDGDSACVAAEGQTIGSTGRSPASGTLALAIGCAVGGLVVLVLLVLALAALRKRRRRHVKSFVPKETDGQQLGMQLNPLAPSNSAGASVTDQGPRPAATGAWQAPGYSVVVAEADPAKTAAASPAGGAGVGVNTYVQADQHPEVLVDPAAYELPVCGPGAHDVGEYEVPMAAGSDVYGTEVELGVYADSGVSMPSAAAAGGVYGTEVELANPHRSSDTYAVAKDMATGGAPPRDGSGLLYEPHRGDGGYCVLDNGPGGYEEIQDGPVSYEVVGDAPPSYYMIAEEVSGNKAAVQEETYAEATDGTGARQFTAIGGAKFSPGPVAAADGVDTYTMPQDATTAGTVLPREDSYSEPQDAAETQRPHPRSTSSDLTAHPTAPPAIILEDGYANPQAGSGSLGYPPITDTPACQDPYALPQDGGVPPSVGEKGGRQRGPAMRNQSYELTEVSPTDRGVAAPQIDPLYTRAEKGASGDSAHPMYAVSPLAAQPGDPDSCV